MSDAKLPKALRQRVNQIAHQHAQGVYLTSAHRELYCLKKTEMTIKVLKLLHDGHHPDEVLELLRDRRAELCEQLKKTIEELITEIYKTP